jgi:ribosomal protein S18 acetylase RimI-like enzyme
VAALALYHSFGFALVGRRPGYYVLTDGKVDALLMRAVLTQY